MKNQIITLITNKVISDKIQNITGISYFNKFLYKKHCVQDSYDIRK